MPTDTTSEATFTIGEEHPSLPGHFPGNPIVPGVVILTGVLEQLEQQHPDQEFTGIRKLKFLHPLRPGQTVTLVAGEISNSGLRFHCELRDTDTRLLEGRLSVARRGVD